MNVEISAVNRRNAGGRSVAASARWRSLAEARVAAEYLQPAEAWARELDPDIAYEIQHLRTCLMRVIEDAYLSTSPSRVGRGPAQVGPARFISRDPPVRGERGADRAASTASLSDSHHSCGCRGPIGPPIPAG
jgi:hypothetical protein